MPSQPRSKNIRVLIVDDSALVRQLLTEILNGDPAIEVVWLGGRRLHCAATKSRHFIQMC